MSSTPKRESRHYLHLLDIWRIVSMVAIVTFHVNEFAFYSVANPIYKETFLYRGLHEFARILPYSGHYIIFLSFYLIGFRGKTYQHIPRWVALFIFAHILIMVAFSNGDFSQLRFEWDIYPFLAVTFLVLAIIQKIKNVNWLALLGACTFCLVLPYDIVEVSKSFPFFKMILTGLCEGHNLGSWPLFPWLALPLMGLSAGRASGKHFQALRIMGIAERFFWGLCAILALMGVFHYHLKLSSSFPIGGGFYCFILRRSPLELWSSFFWVLLICRLSLLDIINQRMKNNGFVLFLQKLNWNRNFVLTYIVQIFLLWVGGEFDTLYLKSPFWFDFYWLFVFLGSELSVQGGAFLFGLYKRKGHA